MDDAERRLRVLSGQFFKTNQAHAANPAFDVKALQRLLDHDNLEMREQMKEFMKADIYIP